MLSHLSSRIRATGPLTVAEYMKEALTNPRWGYYMRREVFGRQGDFVTSPEITQTFGEVIGAWLLHHWRAAGSCTPIKLIELGPGRGTLASDVLRTVCQFGDMKDKLSVHMVEISPFMRNRQRSLLCPDAVTSSDISSEPSRVGDNSVPGSSGGAGSDCDAIPKPMQEFDDIGVEYQTKFGVPILWHSSLEQVPNGYSLIVGHEFLDALPVHQFQRTDRGWREVLVDMNDEENRQSSAPPFRFVLSPQPTPALAYLTDLHKDSDRQNIELCPQAGVVTQQICRRLVADGGLALLVDYGEVQPKPDFTFRSFQQHSVQDELRDPGNADLTADVDFSYLQNIANDNVQCFGPIPQGYFLHSLGISHRVKALLQKASKDQAKQLLSSLQYLTSPKQMGARFKVFVMTPKGDVAPPPFVLRGSGGDSQAA